MPLEPRPIADIARAVVDGTAVDWPEAAAHSHPDDRRLLEQLEVVAGISALHRAGSTPAPVDGPRDTLTNAPATWGPLRVFEHIGRGACGDVYRAWDARLDREVALKLVPAKAAGGASDASSIIHEGRLLARIRHPNVVTIYGAEQVGDRVGLWMELVRGRTLGDMVRAGHQFTLVEVIRIGLEVASAVEAVHAAGLLHRDIKAQNVMRADDGRAVLMDFGTGRELRDTGSDLTGTPLFLAPEVLKGEPATARSDIYSIGVVLYHLLTGTYPVEGRSTRAVLDAHDAGERSSIRRLRPGLPARLARVIDRALDPLPELRYDSARSLGLDLQAIAAPATPVTGLGHFLAAALVVVTAGLVWQAIPASTGAATSSESPILAVLPFVDLTRDADSALIGDGLTAEVVRSLASIEGLAVRPAIAAANRGDASPDPQTAGRQLNANLVLSGSILAANGRLRVNAQLVRVADGVTVWADSISRDGIDVFAAHDEISLAIVNKLRLRMWRGQRRYQVDPDVYYQFLKARGLQARRHADNAGKAAALFEEVITRERAFAPAWAGLASTLSAVSRAVPGDVQPPRDPRLEAAAMEALRLDPLLADAHAALGILYAGDRQWARAEDSFRHALALNPSQATIHTDFVLTVLLPSGRLAEALELLAVASTVEPLSLDVRRVRALIEVDAGRYEEAMASARWVLERDPAFPFADVWLGRALVLAGRPDEALPIFERTPDRFGYLGYLYAVTGRGAEAEALAAARPDSPARQMLIYAGLGDERRAIEALERAFELNWWIAATWMDRPEMAILRGHPRLGVIKRRLGFAEP